MPETFTTKLTGRELLDLWQKIVVSLLPKAGEANLLTWFKNTAALDIDADGTLLVGAPNAFVQGTLSRKYHADLFGAAKEYMKGVVSVKVLVDVSLNNAGDPRTFDIRSLVKGTEKVAAKVAAKKQQAVFSGESNGSHLLNKKYTLDGFVVGESNRLAFAAAQAVSTDPGSEYNPLFIYGGVGLGKTHLLQATGNAILAKHPRKRVVYVTSEQFTNDVVGAIQNRRTKQLKDRYRSVDALIVDDIQFLANKVQTQVEFFHTFNALYEAGKQIIISSDRPPRSLSTLEDRLVSRFGMGMLADVQSPDMETKLAILQRKCQERGALVPGELLTFIAQNSNGNVREVEGALTHIFAHLDLSGTVPSIDAIAKTLGAARDLESTDSGTYRRTPLDHDDVIRAAAEFYNTTPDEIRGQSRKQEVVTPRQVSMFIIRKKLQYSYERIGEIFGGRNHTTVMHAFEKVTQGLQTDKLLITQTSALEKTLGL